MDWWLALMALCGMLYAGAREFAEHSIESAWPLWWSSWWNKHHSWKRKWKKRDGELTGPYYHWWYASLLKTPHQEAFPFSSTLLVWATDAEHFCQMLMTLAVLGITATATQMGIGWALAGVITGMGVFNLVKEFVLKKVK